MRCAWIAIVAILVFDMELVAQHKPYDPVPVGQTTAALGSYLEVPFQVSQGECIHQNPSPTKLSLSKSWFRHQDLSAIPPQLFDPSLGMGNNVVITTDESIARAFAGIYSSKAILSVDANPNDSLIADYLQDPATMAAKGFDGAVYDYNCTASFAASLTANTGWKFPIVSVAAGIQADATGQTTYHLALVSGKLISPIWSNYTSTIAQEQKTYAALLMWEWYLRHPRATTDGTTRYLLTYFNGVSLFHVATSSNSTSGTLNTSVAFAMPAANINAALESSYKSSTRAQVTSFGLATRTKSDNSEDDDFEPFPKPSEIVQQLASTGVAHLEADSTDHRLLSIDMDHKQIITGIPQVVCSRNWQTKLAQGASLVGSLNIMKPTRFLDPADSTSVPKVTLPSCEITVTYSLGGVAIPNRADLNYLLTTDMVDSQNALIATAQFKAEKVTLWSSGLPSLGVTSSTGQMDAGFPQTAPAPPPINHFFTYQWTLQYPVLEDTGSALIKISHIDPVAQTNLTCSNNRTVPVTISATYAPSADATKGTMTLVVTHKSNEKDESLDPSQLEFCGLSEDVTFVLGSGATFPGKVTTTQLLFPRVAQPAPPNPPAIQQIAPAVQVPNQVVVQPQRPQ